MQSKLTIQFPWIVSGNKKKTAIFVFNKHIK